MDFKSKREQAEAAAQPHWEKTQSQRNRAADARRQAKYLNDTLVGRRKDEDLAKALHDQLSDLQLDRQKAAESERAYTQSLIDALQAALKHATLDGIVGNIKGTSDQLRNDADSFDLQARDAQAAGDRLYWPIFNLNLKNPNAAEEETHDPDVLLEKYKTLLGEIEETQNQLKSELAAALAHHFNDEGAE